ncbi:NUDIX domain-containing protein [Streptomyces sp. HK10]|uniref:NUDIX hydrolase n=1 Tax=Streptomyces sp. HK10 TaxID=3373255 RepID=UPI0037484DFD
MAITPSVIGAHLLFERDGYILLGKRVPDALYAPDTWHVPAGGVEYEPATAGAAREGFEELAVTIREKDLELVHTVHMLDPGGDGVPKLQMFFRVHAWQGSPYIAEPDKCSALDWFAWDSLPTPLVDYTRTALDGVRAGRAFTALGWPAAEAPYPAVAMPTSAPVEEGTR